MAQRLCTRCRESVENRRSYTWISREENHIEIAQIIIQELLDQQGDAYGFHLPTLLATSGENVPEILTRRRSC
ncbi:unnamed protein product [Arctia plantaginis]|uniref:Uncharacterized protein n=1 Tax=Arctia plantaginis TaxID=874455 RepID=A0A8S0ZH45_ARCPL|nr:unnamed protein product [Arctia plantaginis]